MKIPWQSLSEAALAGLIQEFVTREGTEYGAVDFNLEEKTRQVRLQIQAGEAVLDAKTGETIWKTTSAELMQAIGAHDFAQTPRRGYSSQVYLKANDDALYFAGPQRSRLVAVSTEDGRLLWKLDDGNYQLVIREDALYAMGRMSESKKIDLLSGKVLADLDCFRGNCTRATGTADSIFARGYRHGARTCATSLPDSPTR